MAQEALTLSQLAARFLGGLPPEVRQESQGEVYRFVHWCGAHRPAADLSPHDVNLYLESLGGGVADLERRLEPVRAFLSFAKKEGLIKRNLAPLLPRKRPSTPATPSAPAPEPVPMTPEGYEALKAELAALKARRPQIAEELKRAMADKDFRENAPLDAARDEQARLEGRIRELEGLLSRAVLQEEKEEAAEAVVRLGSTVLLRNLASGQLLRYTLVTPSEVNAAQGCISSASPVGKAILDRRVGEEVEVQAPAGPLRFRIEGIEA